MVSDGKVHVCGKCGDELLGRVEVENMVEGRERVFISRSVMQWQTYVSGSAYIYAEVGGVTGSRGEKKNIVCGCTAVEADTASMRMIRPEYRERIRSVFGDSLSVPMLFKMPPSVVAWENSGLVKASSSDNGLMVSDEGLAIIDIIADMSKIGLFDGTVDRFSVEDVVTGFSYLHMILPRYRSFVAADYGASVTLENLLAHVPLDWFDWQQMLVLRCVAGVNGDVSVSRAAGVSLTGTIVRMVAAQKKKMKVEEDKFGVVCSGSQVSVANTCIQFMPAPDLPSEDFAWDTDAVYPVDLSVGEAFIPAGPVILQGYKLAVTFEPGVSLRTPRDVCITAPNGAVTIFLNGSVAVELCIPGRYSGRTFTVDGLSSRMYQIHVVCESYAYGTALWRWYSKRFDVLSTSARFNGQLAEFVLLWSAVVDGGGGSMKLMPFVGGSIADRSGIGVQVCEIKAVDPRARYLVAGSVVLKGGVAAGFENCRAIVNGVIEFGESVALGLLSSVVITFKCKPSVYATRTYVSRTFPLMLRRELPLDAYAIDHGGPSDSDGEFDDETSTLIYDVGLEVLQNQSCARNKGKRESGSVSDGAFWIPDVCGLGYTAIVKNPSTVARKLGMAPRVRDILLLLLTDVDLDKLSDSGWRFEYDRWYIVVGTEYHMSWAALAKSALVGFDSFEGNGTLIGYLCAAHNLVEKKRITFFDKCY